MFSLHGSYMLSSLLFYSPGCSSPAPNNYLCARMGADPDEEGGNASAACPRRCLLAGLLLNGRAKPTSSRHAVPDVVITHPEIKGFICILAQTAHPAFTECPEQNVIQHIVHGEVMNLQSQELKLY